MKTPSDLANVKPPTASGGGSRIGKETAKRLVAEGASVVINGRDEAKLADDSREIDPTGKWLLTSAGDIAEPTSGVRLIDAAVAEFGGLDVLVNNAVVFSPKPFLALTEANYDWYRHSRITLEPVPLLACTQDDRRSRCHGGARSKNW